MLKYRINRNNFDYDKVELTVTNVNLYDFNEVIGNEGYRYEGTNSDKYLAVCECDDISELNVNDMIGVTNIMTLDYSTQVEDVRETVSFTDKFQINALNEAEKSFSFFIDKYYPLDFSKFRRQKISEEEDDEEIFLFLNTPHYYDIHDEAVVYFEYDDATTGNIVKTKSIFQYFNETILVTTKKKLDENEVPEFDSTKQYYKDDIVLYEETPYRFITAHRGAWNLNDVVEKENLYNKIFSGDIPAGANYEDEFDLRGVSLLRPQVYFTVNSTYEFWFEKPTVRINLPLTSSFETNLFQNELLNEDFVEIEKKKAINRIVDIEKDVYYPCVCVKENNKVSFEDVYTIKFNLHFREHKGDNWLVENDAYWYGVEQAKNENGVGSTGKPHVNEEITNSNISDLLSFLDFTNSDVHYQKNALKKSFIRLSYYDSTNPADQNLLGYSTIFFNTGEMFAKYAKYMETDGFNEIKFNNIGVYDIDEEKSGIGVGRQMPISSDEDFDLEDFEEKRLSSQFVIKSKGTSNASSEGFYIYLWKDNESALPQDIYMKVEFNHAKYGRTIPFMMPFKENGDKKGFKDFADIVSDFGGNDPNPYGMRKYNKYSYLHLKYQYDKETLKHRYYIDPDTYGYGTKSNEIVINLYEAKIGEK